MSFRFRRLAVVAVAVSVPALVATGCSSSGGGAKSSSTSGPTAVSSSSASAGSTGASGGSTSDPAAAAYKGIIAAPPTAPVTPPKHALAWVVSCGQTVPTCATPANAAVTAAKAIGWQSKLCDGQLNPQGWSACIRQGISAKASGILFIGQDCVTVQAALIEAKKANIPVIGTGGNDCDVTGGSKQFAATVTNLSTMTNQQWWAKIGALQADWIISKTDAKANVLSLKFTDDIWGTWMQNGFKSELASCSGCKISDVLDVGNADVGSGQLTQKFSTALLKNPTVNAIDIPIDGWFLVGLAQAIQSSGRAAKLSVIGALGDIGNFDLIRKSTGQDATVAFATQWTGWAGVDALARRLAKQPVQPAGIGLQVVDANHNLPASGQPFSYNPAVDFQASYKKVWGVA